MSFTCFVAMLGKVNFEHGTMDGNHDDVTSRNVMLWQTIPHFSGLNNKQPIKSEKMSDKRYIINTLL